MPIDITSQHLRNAHELFLLIPLKKGFVRQTDGLVSYASRLRTLLGLIFRPTQGSVEKTLMPTASSIQILRNIYHFHYGVVDRLDEPQLILSATFDSSWETYFHNLVDQIGPFLDALFCHCEGYDGHATTEGYEAFSEFIRAHQVQSGIFYSALADVTTDDLRLLRRTARGESRGGPLDKVEVEADQDRAAWEARMQAAQGPEFEEHRLRTVGQLVTAVWEARKLFPKALPGGDPAQDERGIFDRIARLLAASYLDDDANTKLLSTYLGAEQALDFFPHDPEIKPWLGGLLRGAAPPRLQQTARSSAPPTLTQQDLDNIQGDIVEPYPKVEHGLLLFMQLPLAPAQRAELLRKLGGRLMYAARQPVAPDGTTDTLRLNLAITYAGLRRVGLAEGVLRLFPKEFREGMEQRAGTLGDIGWPSHPDYWRPLARNFSPADEGSFLLSSVDVILTVQGRKCAQVAGDHAWTTEHPLHVDVVGLLSELSAEGCVLRVEVMRRGADHFGLAASDAVESQPRPRVNLQGTGRAPFTDPRTGAGDGYDDTVALGELLLGYADNRGQVARCADPKQNPACARLFKDGSFMVVRKMRQDCQAFDAYVTASAKRLERGACPVSAAMTAQDSAGVAAGERDRDAVRSWVFGRDASGRALAAAPVGDPHNQFDYTADREGKRCPLHAHVRRANPREKFGPRLVRRSFQYGPDFTPPGDASDEAERGHMFIAYNASIAEQYEVIQRWINGGNSTGLLSTQSDLMASVHTIPGLTYEGPKGAPAGALIGPAAPFVSLCWGLYLFAPSRSALGYLADVAERRPGPCAEETARLARLGAARLRELRALGETDEARRAWKQLIEERVYADDATAVWRVIRDQHGGRLRTPYGYLVGDLAGVREVLSDAGARFSVRDYWTRLQNTMKEFYLALDVATASQDASGLQEQARARGVSGAVLTAENVAYEQRMRRGPGYADLGTDPNASLQAVMKAEQAFETARSITQQFIEETPTFDVRDLAKLTVGRVAQQFIGIPGEVRDRRQLIDFMHNFITVSRYSFFPHPERWLEEEAIACGQALRTAYASETTLDSPLVQELRARGYADLEGVRRAVIGINVGFVPGAVAIIAGVLSAWIDGGDLAQMGGAVARLARQHEAPRAQLMVRALLLPHLVKYMKEVPAFPSIYRRALPSNGMDDVRAGETVIVSLQSAFDEEEQRDAGPTAEPWRWLFGGNHGGGAAAQDSQRLPTHGCPMRDSALAVILGAITAVASVAGRTPIRREGAFTFTSVPYRTFGP